MTHSYYSLLASTAEGADSTLTMIVCTIFMIPVIIALLWWLEKTNRNERNETHRKRR